MPLSPKHLRFVTEYLKDLNATQAAIRAGYSPKTAKQQGSRLLTNADIAVALADKTEKRLARAELSADRVLEEYRRVAFSDLRRLFDESGNLKPIHELNDDEAACLASLEVVKKNLEAGDHKTDTVHKLRLWDKLKALDSLAQHFDLLTGSQPNLTQINIVIEKPW